MQVAFDSAPSALRSGQAVASTVVARGATLSLTYLRGNGKAPDVCCETTGAIDGQTDL